MKAIKVDDKLNPVINNGKFVFVEDVDVVKQNCAHAMRQLLGELNYAFDKGIDYLGNVFSGNPNMQLFKARAQENLLAVDGVTGVVTFNYTLNQNVLEYTAQIRTIFGRHDINDNVQIR